MSYPRELRLDGVLRTSGVGGTRKCAPGLRPVSAGTIPDRLLPFGRYDQEAARARFRRSVARLHQLGGQPLAQRPVLGIPLWVQPRPLGDLRDHRLLPSCAGPAARELAQRPQETLAQFFKPLGGLACQDPHLLVSLAARQVTRKQPAVLATRPANFAQTAFSEVEHAFPAKTLMNSAVGQPLGEQFLRTLGPPASFIS